MRAVLKSAPRFRRSSASSTIARAVPTSGVTRARLFFDRAARQRPQQPPTVFMKLGRVHAGDLAYAGAKAQLRAEGQQCSRAASCSAPASSHSQNALISSGGKHPVARIASTIAFRASGGIDRHIALCEPPSIHCADCLPALFRFTRALVRYGIEKAC